MPLATDGSAQAPAISFLENADPGLHSPVSEGPRESDRVDPGLAGIGSLGAVSSGAGDGSGDELVKAGPADGS